MTLVAVVLLAACTTVPGTGRRQLNLISLSQEMTLGDEAYGEALAGADVVGGGADAQMVQRVGERVAAAAERMYPDPAAEFEWEFKLIDEPGTANAWALPGGKTAVYSGLLPITQTEDGLAAVMGHEIAHAIARHGAERMSQTMAFELALGGAALSMSSMDEDDRDLALMALAGIGTVGVMLPYSRAHESEADELGVMLAADAGYDPRAAISLWERMAANSGGASLEFLSTHPSEGTRIERLTAVMPQALELYERAQAQGR